MIAERKAGERAGVKKGVKKGEKKGVNKGLDLSTNIILEIAKKTPMEDIATKYNTSIQIVDKIRAAIKEVPA